MTNIDFNQFIEAFADLVAERVVARQSGSNWPNIEIPKGINVEDLIKQEEVAEPEASEEPVKVPVAKGSKETRIAELNRRNIRGLRRDFSAVDSGNYDHLSKADLVRTIVDFELLVGRTLEEELSRIESEASAKDEIEVPDDTDIEEPEAEDDVDPGELTREMALGLELGELKVIAIDNDIDPAELKGKDVEAVVDLIFGPLSEEPVDSEDSDEYSLEEIEGMSLAELRVLAEDLNEQGAEIDFDRNTARDDLLNTILELLSDSEEDSQ